MHSNDMSKEVERFLYEANELQWRKNRDYHPDKIAFLEILRTCAETGITVEQDLWAKIRKQYIAMRSFVIDGRVESESPRQRMLDIAVYMGMFAFWVKNRDKVVADVLNFVNSQTHCERERNGPCNPLNTVIEICDRCRFQFWLQKHARPN